VCLEPLPRGPVCLSDFDVVEVARDSLQSDINVTTEGAVAQDLFNGNARVVVEGGWACHHLAFWCGGSGSADRRPELAWSAS
jgi:hypothetical protein